MMAFAVTNFITGEVINDPKYVKWFAQYVIQVDGKFSYKEIPMHVCTDEEFDRFSPPRKSSQGLVDWYREEKALMCLDWSGIELYGEDPQDNTRTIDIMLLPCNMRETLLGGTEDRIPADCNWEKDELIKYLGPLRMLTYKNVGSFQLDEFGHDRVIKESTMTQTQFDEHRPSWINTKMRYNLLADETQFLQFGIEEEVEFTSIEVDAPQPSSMSEWPHKDHPEERYYKIASSYITLTMD